MRIDSKQLYNKTESFRAERQGRMMSGVKYDYDFNRETRRNASFFTKAKFLNKYKSCLTLNR